MAKSMDQTENIIIGIDGGGTGCRVAIANSGGKIIGEGRAGPANPTNNAQNALANLLEAIEQARKSARLTRTDLAKAAAFAGLAGVRDDKTARLIADGLPFENLRVVEDTVTSVTGALAAENGSVAPIGTGSFLARRTKDGTKYLGGWGFMLGDDASGAWLGHQLLRQTVLCVEGVENHTGLTLETLAGYDGDARNIYDFCNRATPAEFGKLAPKIVAGATGGDKTATGLMQAGADYILRALSALGYAEGEALCLSGGLGPHYKTYLPPQYRAAVIKAKGSALDGALLLAAGLRV